MKPSARHAIVFIAAALAAVACFAGCLLCGSVDISAAEVWRALTGGDVVSQAHAYIVAETRLPAAVTALLAGCSLGIAGLLMQTTFNNPLAGPSILGLSTGASLGVAVMMLAVGAAATAMAQATVLAGAFIGAAVVMLLLIAFSAFVGSSVMLLIVGILISYLASSAIALLNFFASSEGVHAYVIWGLGSFDNVTRADVPFLAAAALVPAALAFLYAKTLNTLLLGTAYARSVGVNIARARSGILLLAGILTAAVTAWCGPIAFIGLIVPHIARLALDTSNHRILLPATALIGAAIAVLCRLASVAPGSAGIVPINAITPIVGVPIIIYIIVRRRSINYFN